jgi:hypothetical protein
MKATFSKISNQAKFPRSLDYDNDLWHGTNNWSDRVYELRKWCSNWNPLSRSPAMVWWNMKHTWVDATFDIVSPEQFLEHPAIIVPPQWISLERSLASKWYVQKIQAILEFITKSNSGDGKLACLWALVHQDKIQEVRIHIERAWYKEIGFQWWCHVFVHSTTKSVEQILLNSLWIK